jgi:hypothetical protein
VATLQFRSTNLPAGPCVARGGALASTLRISVAGIALFGAMTAAHAQPLTFFDAGPVTPLATPAGDYEGVDLSEWIPFGPTINLTVSWARFNLTQPVDGDRYLDLSTWVGPPTPLVFALYDSGGNLVASNDRDGLVDGAAGLSFGSSGERVPAFTTSLFGQHGSTLPAGVYWLALIAGPLDRVTLSPNWNVSTTASIEIGPGIDQTWLEPIMNVGNTTLPTPPPTNNDCASAITISEDAGALPAWAGSNVGATQDGLSTCFTPYPRVTYKDVWFHYTPSRTGWAQVASKEGPNSFNSTILTKYVAGCGSPQDKCASLGLFTLLNENSSRLLVPVVQGQPVLLSVAGKDGVWGDMILNIDLLPPPCDIQTPAGAIPEGETCGAATNNGCERVPAVFETIAPGQVRSGRFPSAGGGTGRDADWYEFTVTESVTATLTFRAQAPAEMLIMESENVPGSCASPRVPLLLRTFDSLNPCVQTSGRAVLVPGTYRVIARQLFDDGLDCETGRDAYWLSFTTTPCEQAIVTQNPADQTACEGGSVIFTAGGAGSASVAYQWQFGEELGIVTNWYDMGDGQGSIFGSDAIVSGADTPTLTVSNLDAAANVPFRAVVRACAPAFSAPARLTVAPASACAGSCDPIDFNRDGVSPDLQDLVAFFEVFASGPCPTAACNDLDFNNDGVSPDLQDLAKFLDAFAGANC